MLFDPSRALGHGAAAKEELQDKISPSAKDEDQTAVTTAPWDAMEAAAGHCEHRPSLFRAQPCQALSGSCSQHGPKGHMRPPGCRAWAGGSRPQLPAQGLSLGPRWPGCKGEVKHEPVLLQRCLSLPLP